MHTLVLLRRRWRESLMAVLLFLLLMGSYLPRQGGVSLAAGPVTFSGRWGTTHTATWDTETYTATISADNLSLIHI